MKVQFAISILMAFSTTEAFAQSSQVDVNLPKRERNLQNWYHDPPEIQVFPNKPTVRVFADEPTSEPRVNLPSVRSGHPDRTFINVPSSEFTTSAGSPPGSKIGNFASNCPFSRPKSLILPPGHTAHMLPNNNRLSNPAKPLRTVAQRPQLPATPANNLQESSTGTMLKYPSDQPSMPPGLTGADVQMVKTSVSGKAFKRGDLINTH